MDIKEILKSLVSFNTIKDQDNKKIMEFIENYLKRFNFKTKRIGKCLIASNDPNPNIGFIAHTDTVDFESWDGDPFTVQEKDNKFIGLGVCDMKGSIAAILSAIAKIDLSQNKIALYFTNDEEIGFTGINSIKKFVKEPNILIGEPTDNIPVYGTKGLLALTIEFYGKKVHASTPEKGINAIYNCLDFISKLRDFYNNELMIDIDPNFKVPYSSMNIGKINGGETENSVAGKCTVTVDFRINKKTDIDKILNKVKELLKVFDAKLIIEHEVNPKLNESDMKFLEIISSSKETANYITEGSFIDSENIIILGPGPITAHEKNEYIRFDSLEMTEELFIKIIEFYNKNLL